MARPRTPWRIEKLHHTVEKNVFVESVDSLLNAYTIIEKDAFPEVISIWESEDPIANAKIAPFLKNALISADGNTTLIRIRIDKSKEKVADLAPIITLLDKQIAAIEKPSGQSIPYI